LFSIIEETANTLSNNTIGKLVDLVFNDLPSIMKNKITNPLTGGTIYDPSGQVKDLIFDQARDWLPKTIKELLKKAVSFIFDGIKEIVGTADEYGKKIYAYLVDKDHFGLFSLIEKEIEKFAMKTPIFEIEDPYPILPKGKHPLFPAGDLIPVKIPLEYISAKIKSRELVIEADIGN
jgi:hypothetical protein